MKIAVIGANGKSGQLLVKEAIARGHEVTAIVRSANKSLAEKVLQRDALKLSRKELLEFDVVINAFGAWTTETLHDHSRLAEHLIHILAGSSVHLLIVGGAGSLYLDESRSLTLMEIPDFPEAYLPVAKATGDALAIYRQAKNVEWTYLSPAADFVADGERTGQYYLAGEVFQVNTEGQSRISYADYALAMLDLVEKGEPRQARVSVYS